MTRQAENYSNRNKYSAHDLEVLAEMQAEQRAMLDDDNAKFAQRRQTVVSGLTGKYGFSAEGAELIASFIEKEWNDMADMTHLEFAIKTGKIKFTNEEKKAAVLRAYDYYWK